MTPPSSPVTSPAPLPVGLADRAVAQVIEWAQASKRNETKDEAAISNRLHDLIQDHDSVAFTMQFVDRVIRPDDHAVAAEQLRHLVAQRSMPPFLGPIDRMLLRAGAALGPRLPRVVMPLARRRMRQIVGHLVVDARPKSRDEHLARRRGEGYSMNVNLLGEAVLGEREARSRLRATIDLLTDADVDYVSVKISGVASQLNHWAWDDCLARITDRLREVLRAAARSSTFVNLDMEEYHDLHLTIAAFKQVLDEEEFASLEAGIVIQAYLPDSFDALQDLLEWATARSDRGGAGIKIRIVKGANLAMERVDAAMYGWTQAPYDTKTDVDANYKRLLDWAFTPERTRAVRFGIGSHNLFDVAFARILAAERGVTDRVEMEMLEGMAPAQARTIREDASGLLLYTPVVEPSDFDVAIAYLFRRLEENAAPGNFVHDLVGLEPGTDAFARHEHEFRTAVERRWDVRSGSRRTVDRTKPVAPTTEVAFFNEPESDSTVAHNREWALAAVKSPVSPVQAGVTDTIERMDEILATARAGQKAWGALSPEARRSVLRLAADEISRRRADLVSAMVHEAGKCFTQIDPEICEVIDFARYYADRAMDLSAEGAVFEPHGVIAVVPPWNFPVAIPGGGTLAALAAGNAVVFKPSRETPRCAEIIAECLWTAGVPAEALQFVRVPESDVSQHLITSVDAVILTGGSNTAEMFRSWKPDLRLFAETSGKNSIIITPNADIDQAVADLVDSAFGHAGQKCSAASLAICVGPVYESDRFRRQLVDAVESLAVGPADDLATTVNRIITKPNDRLDRGLKELSAGERWLVEPEMVGDDDHLWRPGVRMGVAPGSWYHTTECFGPVLGVMRAADLDDAIAIQNSSAYGLTGGIHSLDPTEIRQWTDSVEVGNAYVNRGITGAIVQRQPFGGWKRSSVGPGAKAGGPNYVRQLGRWVPADEDLDVEWLAAAASDDNYWWSSHFSVEHDPTGLFCESNVFRYRPLRRVELRVVEGVPEAHVKRVRHAAFVCGTELIESHQADEPDETFAARIGSLGVERIRVLGPVSEQIRRAANDAWVTLLDGAVTRSGRVELPAYLREQAVSETLHRFGNLIR